MKLKCPAVLDSGFAPMALVCRQMRENTKENGQTIVVAAERNQGYTTVYKTRIYKDGTGHDEENNAFIDRIAKTLLWVAGGYKVTLVLKQEVIHSLDDKPKHHYSCMDVLDIKADDIKPFTAKTMDITYPGATLTATINDKNLLTEFDVNEPVDVVGDVEWTVVKASIVIDASWKQNVKFAY